ncbi:efflux RND transporter periplasmic adaptor subunit [Amorphus sp. 3PC139-8]|uniref:HlyD family secretion protein n=1 Tax=Amorphus sp. 3PC139-8 TaxID=2735676 RepID=UPI00345D8F17
MTSQDKTRLDMKRSSDAPGAGDDRRDPDFDPTPESASGRNDHDDDFAGAASGRPTEAAGVGSASPQARSAPGGASPVRAPEQELTSPPAGDAGSPPAPAVGRSEGGPLQTSAATPSEAPRKRGRKRRILLVVLLVALIGGGYEGYHWWTVGRFEMSTDDAYLKTDISIVSAKVGGYIATIEVADNQEVRTGEVIATIDDTDYRLAVQSARDSIDVQQATIDMIENQISAARSQVDEAHANLKSTQAALAFAENELSRKTTLVARDFASRQALDTAKADRDEAEAAVDGASAHLTSAQVNVAVLESQRLEAVATLKSLRTALDQAKRDLAYTQVRAPVDGVVGNRAADVGELVQPGSRLAAIVPLDTVYVDANFKETQLARMTSGQEVDVEVDAFPGRVFHGTVDSISPASGALFSLLPPENATGNFTKVVQRLPVRITLAPEATAAHALRPGMSAVVSVDTRTEAERKQAEETLANLKARAWGLIVQARSALGLASAPAEVDVGEADTPAKSE